MTTTGKFLHYKYKGVTDKINVYSDSSEYHSLVASYTSSGNFTFTPTKSGWYDVYLSGAGGGGGGKMSGNFPDSGALGGSGGNGYTASTSLYLTQGVAYSGIVGEGGTAGALKTYLVEFDDRE